MNKSENIYNANDELLLKFAYLPMQYKMAYCNTVKY